MPPPQDFLLTDDGWKASAALPNLTEVIVEGVALADPLPGIMTRLEDLTINRATPAQLVRVAVKLEGEHSRYHHMLCCRPLNHRPSSSRCPPSAGCTYSLSRSQPGAWQSSLRFKLTFTGQPRQVQLSGVACHPKEAFDKHS